MFSFANLWCFKINRQLIGGCLLLIAITNPNPFPLVLTPIPVPCFQIPMTVLVLCHLLISGICICSEKYIEKISKLSFSDGWDLLLLLLSLSFSDGWDVLLFFLSFSDRWDWKLKFTSKAVPGSRCGWRRWRNFELKIQTNLRFHIKDQCLQYIKGNTLQYIEIH